MSSISVIVPCYNCEKTLGRCVDSLLNQQTPFSEIILVDDGSRDGTSGICDKYAEDHANVKTVHQVNGGLVNAWKRGVTESHADYVVFCDSDDHIDPDLTDRLNDHIRRSDADLLLYGILSEYETGEKIEHGNVLKPGLYDKHQINEEILPHYFSTGGMQSELLQYSRCCKAFRRDLLVREVIDEIPDSISLGEDDITTFVTLIKADSVLCLDSWYPYHYMRNNESMIGSYDPHTFDKIELLYTEIERLAEKYNYSYKDQITAGKLSTLILFAKKEATRNPEGYKGFRQTVDKAMSNQKWDADTVARIIREYSIAPRIFARLILMHQYLIAYCCVNLIKGIA